MFDLILARSRWATQVRYSLYIKRISTDEEAGRKPRWTSWSSCFSHVLHMTHTRGEGRWRHILWAQKQKRKKKTLLQAHVSCARLQVQQLQDKKNGGDPWMCGGYKHTQAHVVAFFACGHEGAVLRHPERATAPPPLPPTIPKILQWLPPRRNSFGDAAWIQEIIEIHSDKVWQYECSHLPEIKGLFGFKPGGNPRDIL